MVALLERLLAEPQNLTAIRDLDEAVGRHLADSLVGLRLPAVSAARALVDVGSGGGFPGLALAAALPECRVTLVESERRKADWLMRAGAEFPNLDVVAERSETLAIRAREGWPVAVARALGPPPVALELISPLVEVGGTAVIWRGPSDGADQALEVAAHALQCVPQPPVAVEPFVQARRVLAPYLKVAPTPDRFPRRPGMAAKRPLGGGR